MSYQCCICRLFCKAYVDDVFDKNPGTWSDCCNGVRWMVERKARLHGAQKNKKHSIETKCLGAVDCPKCGERGQLKKRTSGYGKAFYEVDHYKHGNNHASGYSHCCYLKAGV